MNELEIKIEPITRIEGYAKVRVLVSGINVQNVQFNVIEAPRFFEKFMEGKPAEEAPRISERICGVCPTAHHMASVKAVEDAWEVEPPETAVKLRRLMHLGGFISSHTLHVAFFTLPDLLDITEKSLTGLYVQRPKLVEDAMKLREIGQNIVEKVGGRAVHPVTAVPGGVTKLLASDQRDKLLKQVETALTIAENLVNLCFQLIQDEWEKVKLYPNFETSYMTLIKDGVHEIYDGKIRIFDPMKKTCFDFHPKEYLDYIQEKPVNHTFVKYPSLKRFEEGLYRVGPLARLNVADDFSTPLASEKLKAYKDIFGSPAHNVIAYNLARAIEIVNATELAIELLQDNDLTTGKARTNVVAKEGVGVGIVEAPRGTLIHHYETDAQGRIKRVNIIVPTNQNAPSIEKAVFEMARQVIPQMENIGKDRALWMLENVVRAYDPCLSCSVHMVEIINEKSENKERGCV
jgi:F420-non-reducing hydrogenase large subunit